MTKTFGTYTCAGGAIVSLSGFAYRAHDRGKRHVAALADKNTPKRGIDAQGHTYDYDLAAWEAGGKVGRPPSRSDYR